MNAQQAGMMQMQLRHNADDLQSYLKDLQSWEDEIKEKDRNLSKQKPILKEELPPIRSQAGAPSSSGERKKKKRKSTKQAKKTAPSQSRIMSYDYKAWDKFDVDKACEDVDYRVQSSSSSASGESDGDSELEEEERRRQEAVMEKEKGNTQFKASQYELAEESYSKAMELDPLSAVMPANRAMTRLKLQRYEDAENDCTLALALDDSYVKAYFRRATARVKLGKLEDAKLDYEAMLQLEPGNKQAKADLSKLEESMKKLAVKKGFVFPVKRLPHLRSKKPLKRVHIEDIGIIQELPSSSGQPLARTKRQDGNAELTESLSSATATPQSLVSTPLESTATTVSNDSSVKVTELTSTGGHEPSSFPSTEQDEKIATVAVTVDDSKVVSTQPGGDSVSLPKNSGPSQVLPGGTKMEIVQDIQPAEATSEGAVTSVDRVMKQHQQREEVVAVPCVPDSSLQFQADWKRVKRDKVALAKYFKSIPLSKYPAVLWQSLETDIFSEIISILHKDYVCCGLPCLPELTALAKVMRFSVAIMFLSRKDKQSLFQLFQELLDNATDDKDKTAITSLSKVYGVKI